jgi:hypothetical protein
MYFEKEKKKLIQNLCLVSWLKCTSSLPNISNMRFWTLICFWISFIINKLTYVKDYETMGNCYLKNKSSLNLFLKIYKVIWKVSEIINPYTINLRI